MSNLLSSLASDVAKRVLAYLEISGSGAPTRFEFMFNPNEYTYSKSSVWRRTAVASAAEAGVPEFIGSGPRTMTIEILLDKSVSSGSVSDDIDTLLGCLKPTSESIAKKKPLPPTVVFGWGTTVSFKAFVSDLQVHVTLFAEDGTPRRATCTLTLEEVPSPSPSQNPTSGALTSAQTHTVIAGDSLASIAFQAYGRPDGWRAIAEANGIDDPTRLRTGASLLIPSLPDSVG